MASVRESLDVAGKSASIRQLAQQRKQTFPLSLRDFIGAPPPGRILRKTIPLDLLQSKCDLFFNQRERPLFQIRLDGPKFGVSTATVAFDRPGIGYDHDHPMAAIDLAGPGQVLSYPGLIYGEHKYHFSDVNTDEITLNVVAGPPVTIEALIHFETQGVEIRVEDRRDIDFDIFKIKLTLQFGTHDHLVDLAGFVDVVDSALATVKVTDLGQQALVTWTAGGKSQQETVPSIAVGTLKAAIKKGLVKQFVNTDVSVNVKWEPDGTVAEQIEDTCNSRIFEGLSNDKYRDALNAAVTRWLAGGDYYVVDVSGDEHSLIIDYVLPPDQLEPFPENVQPKLDPGLLAHIEHIVVLMMENRSFDHMLGYLSKEGGSDGIRRTDIDGLRGGEANSDHKGHSFPSFPLPDTTFDVDPPHGHVPVINQIDGGKMDGFAAEFASQIAADGVDFDPGKIMGYHRADHVPVYDALAREFLICQRWFAAHPGPTFPNRFYTLTGRLNRDSTGNWEPDNFSGANFKPVHTRTIFDHLTDHGVSWQYYEHRYCTLRMYERYTFDDNGFILDVDDPVRGFYASAQAGTLPSVSFIDPNFADEPDAGDNADGPPADIAAGQNLVGRVANAVLHSPKWNNTLLIVTYDEHGGFFDHVNPLAFRDHAKPVSGIDHYGVRVPAFIVSPWVDRGKIVPDTADTTSDFAFDHTSIAKTIARCFMSANPPDMGERMAAANDLSKVLRSTPRQDIPSIPVPPAPPPKSAVARQAPPDPNSNDFREVMRFIHSQYPIPK